MRLAPNELAILKELLQNKFLRYAQILPIFHEKIGRVEFPSVSTFKTWLSKNKIGRGFQPYYKMFHNQEEMDFVVELMNDKELTWRNIALAFWTKYRSGKMPKRFQKNLQETMTKVHKIRRPEDLLNDGKFKSSDNHRQLPIGSEVVKIGKNKSERQSYVWVKVNDVKLPNANESAEHKKLANKMYKENWKPKHVLIWENYHNEKVKENEIVIFLDGNNRNFDINNLKKITRATNATLAKYQAHDYGEATNAMIEVIETEKALKYAK